MLQQFQLVAKAGYMKVYGVQGKSMSNISPYAMWVQVIWFLFDLDEQGSFANLCYPKRAVHSASFHTLVAAQACVGGESW